MKRASCSGGRFWIGAAAVTLVGCGAFSLDGLSGGEAGVDHDGTSSMVPDAAPSDDSPPSDAGATSGGDATTDAPSDSPEAGPPAACGPDGGWISCGGTCVDPTTDPGNCNGCGKVCATGKCGAGLTESLTNAPATWTFNGSAAYNMFALSAQLTPMGNDLAGTFVYDNPVVVDAFDAAFEFRIGVQGGSRSDGMGFMIERSGKTALGGHGGGLGMAGLVGYGVELDIHNNGVCGDANGDHVGIDDLTVCSAAQGTPTSLFVSGYLMTTVDLADAKWHHAQIALAKSGMSVTVDGNSVAKDVALPSFVASTPYYFGFAAGTGGLLQADGGAGGYRQEVRNIAITFPTPRCL